MSYDSHTESLFRADEILPLPQLIYFFRLQFMQQFVQGFHPQALTDTWITNAAHGNFLQSGTYRYVMRNEEDLFIPPSNLASLDNQPLFLFPKLWRDFSKYDIKILRLKSEFNQKLQQNLLNELDPNYRCDRLLCPHCHLSEHVRTSSSSSETYNADDLDHAE